MNTLTGVKYIWKMPEFNSNLVAEFSGKFNLSFPVVQTLFSRGCKNYSDFENFLSSTLEKDVHHPSLLKDCQKAVERIISAIKNNEKILICGDYDVDGITSSAMMMTCLLPLGAQVNFFLPHRVHDGYGLSVKTVRRAALNKYKVLITVDNGITAFEPALEAKKLGIDLIITDHHRPHDHLPEAFAVIDPYQIDCAYPYKKLAGVGVTFKLISLIYEKLGKKLPNKVFELLMLGTVADVVPLTGENRFWVRYCLSYINKSESLSLNVLRENARVTKPDLTAGDIGFFLAPQINALGRLEDPRQAVSFLLADDEKEVRRTGIVLKELNEARKSIEKKIIQEIDQKIQNKEINIDQEPIIIAVGSWQAGVIGLAASRLMGTYARPAIVLTLCDNKILKGSCRSISEFNIFQALESCSDLLNNFGGHAMAAGLSMHIENLEKFKERMFEFFKKIAPDYDFKNKLLIDAQLILPEANKKLVEDMQHLEPFGCENHQPTFFVKDVSIIDTPVLLKDAHVKCTIFQDGIIKPLIFFSRPDLYEKLQNMRFQDNQLTFAGYVSQNYWNGRISVELQGIDIL
ncbi:single-stranded-DNA-specific exonuclease RecJ [Candidatus Dependentiae bacterium]|nr:single-stranded-DNA-specific exonuclease RecJ [Candidatus Dependentiae bacterium]